MAIRREQQLPQVVPACRIWQVPVDRDRCELRTDRIINGIAEHFGNYQQEVLTAEQAASVVLPGQQAYSGDAVYSERSQADALHFLDKIPGLEDVVHIVQHRGSIRHNVRLFAVRYNHLRVLER